MDKKQFFIKKVHLFDSFQRFLKVHCNFNIWIFKNYQFNFMQLYSVIVYHTEPHKFTNSPKKIKNVSSFFLDKQQNLKNNFLEIMCGTKTSDLEINFILCNPKKTQKKRRLISRVRIL